MHRSTLRKTLKPSLSAIALTLLLAMPICAGAAGLGKLTVLSVLGQPLRAEVELSASGEELSSLSARLATPEAFKQAGIEYVPAVGGIRFSLDKRPSGQPYLRLSSERAINEAFLDILVEMSWSSGRLVREYTFLLDPPEAMPKAAAPVSLPEAPREAPAAQALPVPPPREALRPPGPPLAVPAAEAPPPRPQAKSRVTEVKAPLTRTVKTGDTLGKIAQQARPEGVSLDQMLVALFRSNEDAFDAHNMNRLRAGRILNIPEAATIQAVDANDAKKTVVAQASDFNAYRKKLAASVAAAPVKETAPQQAASGKITPKVQDKAPAPMAGKDKLEVSKSATPKEAKLAGDASKRIAALEEDLLSRGKALKEANERIAALEKNTSDLKKLMELKNQNMALAQQQAQSAKAARPEPVAPAAAKPEPPKVEAPKVEAPKVEPPKVEVPKVEPPKVEPPKVEAPKVEAPKPEEARPAPPTPPKPAVVNSVPPPPPSFVDDNPEMVYGGAAALVLLLAYLGYAAKRRKALAGGGVDPGTTGRSNEPIVSTRSVIASTGGQSVDTTDSSLLTDFSQGAVAAVDSDEGVDPVAEADVYMAYGRDTQAEEILLEALKMEPARHAIRLKLLEIYAARKSMKQFESVATELYSRTGGVGPDWEKAALLVQKVDPENPLYGRRPAELGEPPAPALPDEAVAAPALSEEPPAPAFVEPAEEVPAAEEVPMSLDFDLDLGGSETPAAVTDEQPAVLDFDLTPADGDRIEPAMAADIPLEPAADSSRVEPGATIEPEPVVVAAEEDLGIEFSTTTTEATLLEVHRDDDGGKLPEFDFDLGHKDETPVATVAPSFDLSGIDLELGAPAAEEIPSPATAAPAAEEIPAPASAAPLPEAVADAAPAAANEEVATKLELAHAYEEMGDKEGARELLEEVIKEGSAEQQETARIKLAQLG